MPKESTIPADWRRRAEAMRRRVNFGWFWFEFSRGLMVCTALCALMLWLLRLQKVTLMPAWMLGLGCLLVACLIAWSRTEPRTIGVETALSRLDVGWKLNHRLVSAWRGVGKWPALPERRLPLKLKPLYAGGPLLLAALFLLLALLLPLPPDPESSGLARAEPADWKALQSLAEELEEKALVAEEATRALRRELRQLREKPMEDWYNQSTLEATDRLRSRLGNDAVRLMDAMENTSALLQLAQQGGDQLQPAQQQEMQAFLEQMRQQMQQGGMQLNPDLMKQLQDVDLSRLQQINPAELQRLDEQLCQQCEGMGQAMAAAGFSVMDGGEPGAGGISRGGGPSQFSLRDFETTVEPVIPMALDPGNLENARIGDLLELRNTLHADEREAVAATAGSLRSAGGEGEVVWEQDVLPSEQKVLKEFYK